MVCWGGYWEVCLRICKERPPARFRAFSLAIQFPMKGFLINRRVELFARGLVVAIVSHTLWFADSRVFAQGDYSPVSEDNVIAIKFNHYFIGEPQYVFAISDEPRGASPVATEKAADEYGLAVGKKMPVHVVDFVNGKYRHGCPSVIISNGKSRGIIVWTRTDAAAMKRLAVALDAIGVDGEKLRAFVVAYDVASTDLKNNNETWSNLKHVIVGKGRSDAKDQFEKRGVDAKVQMLVFFLDRKDIQAMRSFGAEELTDAKIAEIAADAAKFAAGDAVRKD